MSLHKNVEKICLALVAICVAIAVVFINAEYLGISSAPKTNTYEQVFFDELSINTIDVIVDEADWQQMLDSASAKEYIRCNLVINGEVFTNIAIRPKGNSSLSQVASSDSDRYSFKIEFDHYDSSKTYYGLDKLALNNIIQDNTYMKDYMVYSMMDEFGVPSPLVNYTEVTVNGEAFGLYLAVEVIEEAFLQRNFGNNYGSAYKPETTGGGAGGGGDRGDMGGMPDMADMPDNFREMLEEGDFEGILNELPDDIRGQIEQSGIIDQMQGQMGQMQGGMGQMGEIPTDMQQGQMQGGMGQMSEIPTDMQQGQMQGGMGQMGDIPTDMQQGQMQGGMGQMGDIPTDMQQGQMQGGIGQMGEIPTDMQQGQMQGGMGQMGEIPTDMQQGQMQGGMGQMSEIPTDMQQGQMQGGMGQMGDIPTDMQQGQMQGGMGQMGDIPTDLGQNTQTNDRNQGGMQGGMGQMGSTSSTGTLSSALGYDGDDIDSYSYIFDNAVTNISNTDKNRLISSLKQLNEQENLDEVLDIEGIIRYFIVHNFVLNFDSYTGGIMHNYYMYEENGVLTMLPWDYNLSFVSFQTSYTTEQLVNFPIDTPVSSGTVESRPMLSWIFENEEYTELYHELFAEFIEVIFDSGYFDTMVSDVFNTIAPSVSADPSKFCTYDQFTNGISVFQQIVNLRAESVRGQLDGTIPSTSEGQSKDSSNLIDTGKLDATDAGSERTSGQGNTGGGMGQSREPGVMTGDVPTDMGQMQGGMGQMGEIPNGATDTGNLKGQQTTGQSAVGGQSAGRDQMQGGMGQMGGDMMDRVGNTYNTLSNHTFENDVMLIASISVMFIALLGMAVYKKVRK